MAKDQGITVQQANRFLLAYERGKEKDLVSTGYLSDYVKNCKKENEKKLNNHPLTKIFLNDWIGLDKRNV